MFILYGRCPATVASASFNLLRRNAMNKKLSTKKSTAKRKAPGILPSPARFSKNDYGVIMEDMRTHSEHKPQHVCNRCGRTPASVHRILKVAVCRECLREAEERTDAFEAAMMDEISSSPGPHCLTIFRFGHRADSLQET